MGPWCGLLVEMSLASLLFHLILVPLKKDKNKMNQ